MAVMYIVSIIAFAICFLIQHMVGGICDVVEKTIGWAYHNRRLEALANLNRGVCDPYKRLSMMASYITAKIFGFPTCREIHFYETITLTRIFVAEPLSAISTCISLQHDLCAGVVGGQTVAKFVFEHGVYLYFIVYVLSPTVIPMVRFAYKAIKKGLHELEKLIKKHHNK